MSKIVQVVNTMISNKDKITDVLPHKNEYFFLYDAKYKWSVSYNKEEDAYWIYIYTTTKSLEEIREITDWDSFSDFTYYSTKEIKTRESYESFNELYQILSEKAFGLDSIFDDIILNG